MEEMESLGAWTITISGTQSAISAISFSSMDGIASKDGGCCGFPILFVESADSVEIRFGPTDFWGIAMA
jgi:hypothetical protein